MEWDFTTNQVLKGEVKYKLKDFLDDLYNELKFNFSKYKRKELNRLKRLYYRVMYFGFLGNSTNKIAELLKIDPEFAKLIIDNNEENIQMLEAIIMSKFLKNLRESGGLFPNQLNLDLTNAQLRKFHKKHNL
jgi:hypothetical protein